MDIIKYDHPAKKWKDALPLGNGFSGVMIFGSLKKETLSFNDVTLWSGYPKDYNSKDSLEYLDKVRELIFEGKNSEADALCEDKLKGFYSEAYMPLGDAQLKFKGLNSNNYIRQLDLSNAVHTVKSDGCVAECFSSNPDKITVYRIKNKDAFSCEIKLKSKLESYVVTNNDSLYLLGHAPDYAAPVYVKDFHPIKYDENKGMAFCLCAKIKTDGEIVKKKKSVQIKDAKVIRLYFATSTGFKSFDEMPDTDEQNAKDKCDKILKCVDEICYDTLKSRHIEDYSALFKAQGVSFLSENEDNTDDILNSVKAGKDERALCELMYNYGKYMIIAGSRKGGQPLNLQGIWNDSVRPPWSSNYTVNINTEMNYWGASRAGLSDCVEPLVKMVDELTVTGAKTAKINYGCDGFACNHNVDIWRKTPPVMGDANYMFAPLCGVWLTNEVYSHYKNGFLDEYTDKIKNSVTEAARFCSDFLVLHDGKYVICPSVSPENVFSHGGKKCKLDYASAFDMALVREAFNNALEISDDEELKEEINKKIPLLYEFKEGKNGICEWHDDYDTPENGHRHFSPLMAFYPGHTINYYNDERKDWVEKLFRFRLENSARHIGWSAAWAICLASKLRDGDTVRNVILGMLKNAVFDNLFSVHPPSLFQIDGNLGFVAGINEMLITEEDGKIELIPALPENFKSAGRVDNIVVNKAKISFSWENGKIISLKSDTPVSILNKNIDENAKILENVTLL